MSTGAAPDIYSNVWRNDGKCSSTGDNLPPTASFSYNVNQLRVSFSDTSTDDSGVTSRNWDFGDGTSTNSQNPTHNYASSGSYTVTLTVTDEQGLQDAKSQVVTVTTGTNNEAPTASFTSSTNGLTAQFTNNSRDDKAVVSSAWDFGDGSSSNAENPTHTYTSAGTYSVTLTVSDAEGLQNSIRQNITVDDGTQGCSGVSPWNSSTMYQVDDQVSYNGNKYKAIWWSQGAQPDIFSNVWTSLGACR